MTNDVPDQVLDALDHALETPLEQPDMDEGDLQRLPDSDDEVDAYDDGDEGPDRSDMSDAEKQATYLAGQPDWAVIAPGAAAFANATWMRAGGNVLALVAEVFTYEEFRHLNMMPYAVRWRRRTKPLLRNRYGEVPLLASIEVIPPRIVWEMVQREMFDFPRLLVDLNWQHWEQAIKDGMYLAGADVQWALHRALSVLDVENDIIKRIPPDVQASEHEVRRFGMKGPGWSKTFKAQQELWPDLE